MKDELTDDVDHGMPEGTDPADDSVGTALVEVAPGTALVFGSVPEGLDLSEFHLISGADRTAIVDAVAAASSVLNGGAQVANGLAQVHGLVRLAPETMKALRSGAEPVRSGGWNIGVLRHGSQQFSNQVRWLPSSGAQAAGIAASMGSALAMISIQMQLSELTQLAQENISLTETVLKSVRHAQWAELTGLEQAMSKSLAEANAVGRVTQPVWENVLGHEAELRKQRDLFRRQVEAHVSELASRKGHKERRQYIEQSGEAMLLDVHSLLIAHKAWFEYQALRAGRIRLDADTDPTATDLLNEIVSNARREYDQVVAEVGVLLDRLHRELSVLAELPGVRTLPFTSGRKSARDVAQMAAQLLHAVERLSGSVGGPIDDVPMPPVTVVADAEQTQKDLRILKWHLGRQEQLLAIATVRSREVGFARFGGALKDGGAALAGHLDGVASAIRDSRKGGGLGGIVKAWNRGAASGVESVLEPGTELLLAVTEERMLFADLAEFRAQGSIQRVIPNDQIRFVRPRTDEGAHRAEVDVVTEAENFGVGFRRGSSDDQTVMELVELLVERGNRARTSIVPAEST